MESPWKGNTAKQPLQSVQIANTRTTQVLSSGNVALNLTTNDGDKVSISLAASTQSDYLNYMAIGQDTEGDYASQLQMSSTKSEQGFTMTVEGDLNEQELKDIGTALKTIDKMMTSFVQGRLEPIVAKADKSSQLDSISNLSLKMSFTQNALTIDRTETQYVNEPQGGTYDAQGRMTESRPAPNQSGSAQLQNRIMAEADDLSTNMAKQLAKMRKLADHLSDAVRQIFDKNRQYVKKLNPDDAFGPALIDRMHKDLLAKMLKANTIQPQIDEAGAIH
jgi:hypothetical protein